MKALLLGASGMLGRNLAADAPPEIEIVVRSRRVLDVTDAEHMAGVLDAVRPELVINASGYTAVDRAESERSVAFAVNGAAVDSLAKQCAERDIVLVHFSSDYVFDGSSTRPYREDDPPAPLNVYGESKLAGEEAVLASGTRALLLRTQWLFGHGGRSLPRTMAARARRREASRVVHDQRGRPTSAMELARITWQLVCGGALGRFHVAGGGDASWFEVAQQTYAHFGVPELVTPCSAAEQARLARRPPYSVLDTQRVEEVLGQRMKDWRVTLGEFLTSLAEEPLQSFGP